MFRKEMIHFFGSLTGTLAILVFLVVSGLFLWVFPGSFNIPASGYASLEPFFRLAPWLFLFLVPAITMRQFAGEKRDGTLELLLTKPLGDFRLVASKFLASLVIAGLSLLPTLLYFYSVGRLGNPPWNLDAGSTWGSYAGLLLLAALQIAIGLFASALTSSQVVAFTAAALMSFLFYLGFEFVAGSGIPYFPEKILGWLSINEHYLSLSRGVLDIRDLLYFGGMTALFLFLAMVVLRRGRAGMHRPLRKGLAMAAVLLAAGFLGEVWQFRIDLTADKRFSLAPVTRNTVKQLGEPVAVELFLEGELPPGFRRLRGAILDKLRDLNRYAAKPVKIILTDPYKAAGDQNRNRYFEEIARMGVQPTDLRQTTRQGTVTTLIFPGAVITMGNQKTGVSFLRNNTGVNHEVNLNHSAESIEYELVSALNRLMVRQKPGVTFLQGHGELSPYEVDDLASALSESFRVGFAETRALYPRDSLPGVLVIAGPREPFSETDKFIIDQLVMRGCRLMWLLDPVEVSLDSLSQGYMTLAFPRNLNLDDQLFRYGVRLNYDLVQDVACARILVNTAVTGNRPAFTPQPWYYSPLLTPSPDHPVSRNLDLVYAEFVSSLDTLADREGLRTRVLLSTSPYGRIVKTPAGISLESINRPPARELFNRPSIPAGVLIEGTFTSVFRNRILDQLDLPAVGMAEQSPPTQMMVFSDGNLIANKVRIRPGGNPEILPLGYDRVSRQTFGNKDFFVNAIQYLGGREGIMQLRNTSYRMRLIDAVRWRSETVFWKWLNTAVPAFTIILGGVAFSLWRRRKYAVHKS